MHSFPPAFCVRAKPNTEPSQSSASNPIGTEKRHSVRVSCAGPRVGGGRRTGHNLRAPVEDRSRVAGEGLPRIATPSGFLPPFRSGARLQLLLYERPVNRAFAESAVGCADSRSLERSAPISCHSARHRWSRSAKSTADRRSTPRRLSGCCWRRKYRRVRRCDRDSAPIAT